MGCEIVGVVGVFHMQLYPSGGPLLPDGADRSQLKDQPRVRLEIDGEAIAASIYFAGEFAVVADRISRDRPVLSPGVGAALEKGRELTVRLDLLRDRPASSEFDAMATVKLAEGASIGPSAPFGADADSEGAIRRCPGFHCAMSRHTARPGGGPGDNGKLWAMRRRREGRRPLLRTVWRGARKRRAGCSVARRGGARGVDCWRISVGCEEAARPVDRRGGRRGRGLGRAPGDGLVRHGRCLAVRQ